MRSYVNTLIRRARKEFEEYGVISTRTYGLLTDAGDRA